MKENIYLYELKDGKGYLKKYNYENEYINEEKDGKGKKYYRDDWCNRRLIFEGEFMNNKKNGKGKEYNPFDKLLLFEGEYLNDYKIEDKQYLKARSECEGEYLFNKKWNGKGYDAKGKIIYELINGTGKVKEFDFDGL